MKTEVQQMVEDLEKRESKLTEWERRFVDSMSLRLGRNEGLTRRQEEKLTEIWERVT